MRRGDGLTWALGVAGLLVPIWLDVRSHPDHLPGAVAVLTALAAILTVGIAIARRRLRGRRSFR